MAQLSSTFPSDPGSPEPEYLTVAEAAALVHCCERTIRRAIGSRCSRIGAAHPPGAQRGDRARRTLTSDGERHCDGDEPKAGGEGLHADKQRRRDEECAGLLPVLHVL